jgi:copper chaperone CopZ
MSMEQNDKMALPIYRLNILNMKSEQCALLIENTLRNVSGVKKVSVDFKNKIAIINGIVCIAIVINKIQALGFLAEEMQNSFNRRVYYY